MFVKRLRLPLLMVVLALVMMVGLADGRPVTAESSQQPAQQQTNLLTNPGFEGGFSAWSGIGEIQMAAGWTPWWIENPQNYPQWFRPEYKRAEAVTFPDRVRSGESSQQYFTFHASHFAGMYQQVFNVTPGQNYQFTIWAQVWSSTGDDPNVSNQPANPHLQVGIDPTGQWALNGPSVVWSPEAPMSSHIDQWGAVSVEAVAQNNVITVMVRTSPEFPNKHNDTYWDDAALFAVGQPQPTSPPPPPPTNTPGPPTNTPIPSDTPAATNTSAATNTPPPTNTSAPTDTPEPTDTAEPSPTPEPSSTPAQTATEVVVAATTAATETTEPTMEATEIAAVPTEENTPEPTEEIPTSESEGQGENNNSIVAVSLVGLGVVVGLLVAGAITMMRRNQ